ncbi:MAG: GDYXXLXY domain-containing protein [Helicobacteraceae bacterium]|jgi:uncharacterized membrane-anchored protein|nr:GDYXXLXY domain-containing protein [Helicobacteraceae bacterium]
MRAKIILAVLGAALFLQIAALIYQIIYYESVLTYGKTIVLQIRPLDPYNPFTGRYVNLRLDSFGMKMPKGVRCPTRERERECKLKLFVAFKDNDGISEPDEALTAPPSDDRAYLRLEGEGHSDRVSFNYPFDRFYMKEQKARYVDRSSSITNAAQNKVVVIVKALGGKGVVENVLINDIPISQYIEDMEDYGDYK